jgi:KaiC/GvpD/RAD55 family RecA-like ATPase
MSNSTPNYDYDDQFGPPPAPDYSYDDGPVGLTGQPTGDPVDLNRSRLRKAANALAAAVSRGDDMDEAWQALREAMGAALTGSSPLIEEEDLTALWDASKDLPKPTLAMRADGAALLYEAKIHWLSGEPGSGKTWLALWWTIEQVRAGNAVLFLDMESDPITITSRLRALGITIEELPLVKYLRVRWEPARLADTVEAIVERIVKHSPSLVVLDGMAATLAALGRDENSNSDVSGFTNAVLRPIAAAGPAVVVVDHLAKPQAEGKGGNRYSRGASAKLADASGVAYLLSVSVAFSQNKPGIAKLIVGKDRNGAVGAAGECVAEVFFTPADGGLTVEVKAPEGAGKNGGRFIPDGWMGKLSRELESTKTMTATELRGFVGAKAWDDKSSLARKALDLLVKHGHVALEEAGPRKTYTFVKPFDAERDGDEVRDAEFGPDPSAPVKVEEPF